jgi:DNA invertase Pin-like site-specific DNA recombinase
LIVGCEKGGRSSRGSSSGTRRVSTRQQDTDRQTADLLAAGLRRDDLCVDHGVSGARASWPALDEALRALHDGDTLVITTLDGLGRSTQNMLALAEDPRGRGASLRVLNLGGGDVDTATPMGSMVFTVMAALAQMELEIKRERITDSVSKRRAAGKDLGGRRQAFTDSQVRNAVRLIDAGEPAARAAREMGMSRATSYRRIRDVLRAEAAAAITSREGRWGVSMSPPSPNSSPDGSVETDGCSRPQRNASRQ